MSDETPGEDDATPDESDGDVVCEVCGKTFEDEAARRDHLYSVGLVY